MKRNILFLLFIIFSTPVLSQVQPDTVVVDSLEVAVAEEEMMYKEDTADFVYYNIPSPIEYVPGDDDPDLLADRLHCISRNIPLVYNDKVHAFINYFTVRDREYTRLMMRRKNLYFPLFEKYLAKYGLPEELKYLSIIESGLNARAISRARAVGLWQFMSATGKYYGVPNNWYIDDRMDPEKSTDAACRYLRDLYNMFHDWELALAAYNTGPGNVKKAIRRSGYKRTFWEIYPNLHRETRGYVPQFIAITYTMNYLDEHNFVDEGSERLVTSDTIHVNNFLHFETFANLTGVCLEDLQKLNPSMTRNAVPDQPRNFIIRVPVLAKEALTANRYAILDSASKVGRKELEAIAKNDDNNIYGRDRVVHKVRSGEVLGSIAMRYGVKVTDIRSWNNLHGNMIRSGQRLNIYLRSSGRSAAVASAREKEKPSTSAPVAIPGSKTYVVQEGDTLWAIARKFEGLTVEKIKTLNNITNNKLRPGQKLIIGM
jgi:membrane-bound lytic murein transglycosylase D